jgi:hypothetical protein
MSQNGIRVKFFVVLISGTSQSGIRAKFSVVLIPDTSQSGIRDVGYKTGTSRTCYMRKHKFLREFN